MYISTFEQLLCIHYQRKTNQRNTLISNKIPVDEQWHYEYMFCKIYMYLYYLALLPLLNPTKFVRWPVTAAETPASGVAFPPSMRAWPLTPRVTSDVTRAGVQLTVVTIVLRVASSTPRPVLPYDPRQLSYSDDAIHCDQPAYRVSLRPCFHLTFWLIVSKLVKLDWTPVETQGIR